MGYAYNHYKQFTKWTTEKIWFVTRMKTNANSHVTKVMVDNSKKKNPKGVLQEQYVIVSYTEDKVENRLKLRRIIFKAEDGKDYVFITNNSTLKPTEIANIYKYRWMNELSMDFTWCRWVVVFWTQRWVIVFKK